MMEGERHEPHKLFSGTPPKNVHKINQIKRKKIANTVLKSSFVLAVPQPRGRNERSPLFLHIVCLWPPFPGISA